MDRWNCVSSFSGTECHSLGMMQVNISSLEDQLAKLQASRLEDKASAAQQTLALENRLSAAQDTIQNAEKELARRQSGWDEEVCFHHHSHKSHNSGTEAHSRVNCSIFSFKLTGTPS